MKIKSLQISNILSFKYCADVADAEKITFDDGLNIIIGENGSGKSTALEVINFLFKRVLYRQYNMNQELYTNRNSINPDQRKQILLAANNSLYRGFRLDPNWDTMDKARVIRIEIKLDEIDIENLSNLKANADKIKSVMSVYTSRGTSGLVTNQDTYIIDVTLNKLNETFTVDFRGCARDFGYEYLEDYNFFKDAINLYNLENPIDPIENLYESFTLISSYRNYHGFDSAVSLKDAHPSHQIQNLRNRDYAKSLNTGEPTEPSIFGMVRLRVAQAHFGLITEKLSEIECEEKANRLPFIIDINKRLKVVNLECRIKLTDLRTWQYSFQFHDSRRNKILNDINSLSAGQKAIIHLVFEAYGRGNLKGGVVIIDEPEIHLHYQFQNEYLQVVRELNEEQSCQYILVTHSEALINSSTINQVRRFSLNGDGHTEVKAPVLTTDQRMLIKILDNTRATYAFFAKKVLLVEGDTDRYLFKSIIQEKYPEHDQKTAVLDIGGKGNYVEWTNLFEAFGLTVYRIADFDYVVEKFYPGERGVALRDRAAINAFKSRNPDWEAKIDAEHGSRTFILKDGDLESYLGINKGLTETIVFCNNHLKTFLADDTNLGSVEIRDILKRVCQ